MKIAIDCRFVTRKQRGMPIYVFQLAKLLPHFLPEHQFYLLINREFEHNEEPTEYAARLETIAQAKNVKVYNLGASDDFSWEQKLLPQHLSTLKIDLLHMPGNRVCLFTKVRQIATFHDTLEWTELANIYSFDGASGLKNKLYIAKVRLYLRLVYWLGIKKINHLLTISASARDDLVQHFPRARHKTSFVHHGIPEQYVANPSLNSLDLRKGVLMLGGDSYQKNPENAIKAWSALPLPIRQQHPLTIAGFTGDDSSIIIKTLNQLKLTDEVRLIRWVETQTLVELFQKSAVLLFVSRHEGFGFPLVQAMACHTPSVISNHPVLTEIAGTSALSSAADCPNKITQNLEKLLSQKDLWQQLSNACQDRQGDFSWQHCISKISNLYQQQLDYIKEQS